MAGVTRDTTLFTQLGPRDLAIAAQEVTAAFAEADIDVGELMGRLLRSVALVREVEEGALQLLPDRMLTAILEAWNPTAVWLFGSRARGEPRETSDWDLLVLVPDDTADDLLEYRRINQAFTGFRERIDCVVMREGEFEEERRHPGSLASIVYTEGVRVYAR